MDWFLLPSATDSMIEEVSKAAKGRFTGDPSYVYEHSGTGGEVAVRMDTTLYFCNVPSETKQVRKKTDRSTNSIQPVPMIYNTTYYNTFSSFLVGTNLKIYRKRKEKKPVETLLPSAKCSRDGK